MIGYHIAVVSKKTPPNASGYSGGNAHGGVLAIKVAEETPQARLGTSPHEEAVVNISSVYVEIVSDRPHQIPEYFAHIQMRNFSATSGAGGIA